MNFNDYAITLSRGDHKSPQQGMCIMECVAYIAGEQHTDHPACASQIVTNFAIGLNDIVWDADRNKLLPFVLRIVNSRGSVEIERIREDMIMRFYYRAHITERGRNDYSYYHAYGYDSTSVFTVIQDIFRELRYRNADPYFYNHGVQTCMQLLDDMLKLTDVQEEMPVAVADKKLKELEYITVQSKPRKEHDYQL